MKTKYIKYIIIDIILIWMSICLYYAYNDIKTLIEEKNKILQSIDENLINLNSNLSKWFNYITN